MTEEDRAQIADAPKGDYVPDHIQEAALIVAGALRRLADKHRNAGVTWLQ